LGKEEGGEEEEVVMVMVLCIQGKRDQQQTRVESEMTDLSSRTD